MGAAGFAADLMHIVHQFVGRGAQLRGDVAVVSFCLLYTSDAADELRSV